MSGTAIMRACNYSGLGLEYMLLAYIHRASSRACLINISNGNLRFL